MKNWTRLWEMKTTSDWRSIAYSLVVVNHVNSVDQSVKLVITLRKPCGMIVEVEN
jgi:hypothetical protein